MKPKPTELGAAIRAARMAKSLSQEQLAEIVGITPTHMKHIESEHRKPSIEVLFALVSTLNLSLDDILFPPTNENKTREITLLLRQCENRELSVIKDLLRSLIENRDK